MKHKIKKEKNIMKYVILSMFLIAMIGVASAGVPTYTYVNDATSWFKEEVGFGTDTPTEMIDVDGNVVVSENITTKRTQFSENIQIGVDSQAYNINTISIGNLSFSNGTGSIAIGKDSNASDENSVSIGKESNAESSYSVNIGYLATTKTGQSIAIGQRSEVDGFAGTCIGTYCFASGQGISAGYYANAQATYSIAIGTLSNAQGQRSVVVGKESNATHESSIALGYNVTATNINAVAIGSDTRNAVANTLKVGGAMTDVFLDTNLDVTHNITASNINLTRLFYNNDSIQIGYNSNAIGSAIAIGEDSNASEPYAVSIGYDTISVDKGIAIGYDVEVTASSGIGIGRTISVGSYGIALGYNTDAVTYSTVLGRDSEATQQLTIAIGSGRHNEDGALASGVGATAIGTSSIASGGYSIGFGYNTTASATNSVAIGTNTTNAIANSFKVGGDMTNVFFDTTLNVTGIVKLEANVTELTCGAGNEGAIYYDGDEFKHYGCNSTSWNALY